MVVFNCCEPWGYGKRVILGFRGVEKQITKGIAEPPFSLEGGLVGGTDGSVPASSERTEE